jgi:hypothetical protein
VIRHWLPVALRALSSKRPRYDGPAVLPSGFGEVLELYGMAKINRPSARRFLCRWLLCALDPDQKRKQHLQTLLERR